MSHRKVEDIINPFKTLSLARLDEEIYKSYIKLYQLSRRSRYLIKEDLKREGDTPDIVPVSFTYSKHFKKAVHHLNNILIFIHSTYNEQFPVVDIKCIDLDGQTFNYFKIVSASPPSITTSLFQVDNP